MTENGVSAGFSFTVALLFGVFTGGMGYSGGYYNGNNAGPKSVYLRTNEENKTGITTVSNNNTKKVFIQQPDYSFKSLDDIKKEKLSQVESGAQQSKEQVESEIENLLNKYGR